MTFSGASLALGSILGLLLGTTTELVIPGCLESPLVITHHSLIKSGFAKDSRGHLGALLTRFVQSRHSGAVVRN